MIAEAALKFRDRYHAREDLVAENSDWSPTIALVATDTGESLVMTLKAGRVTSAAPLDPARGTERPSAPTLIVSAVAQVLRDILDLKLGPNDPYLFGDLVVRGPEADFLRLDYLASRLCPE